MSGECSQTPLIPPERRVQLRTGILLHSFDPATHVTALLAPRAKQVSATPPRSKGGRRRKPASQFTASGDNDYINGLIQEATISPKTTDM